MRGSHVGLAAFALVATPVLGAQTGLASGTPQIEVRYSQAFEKKLEKTYGVREKAELERIVQRQVARAVADRAARVEVLIEDATPNRPTLQELSDRPGLSFQSFGLGGASASGKAFDAAGTEIAAVSCEWRGTQIEWAWSEPTWGDADTALSRFARKLGKAVGER
jgi:hypothetical protein